MTTDADRERERERERIRRILSAWQRPKSELWLVANSRGDDAAADMVRQIFAIVGPLAARLEVMLDGDAEDQAQARRAVYRIQTTIAAAYVDAQHEADDEGI